MKISIIDKDSETLISLMQYLLDNGHDVSTAPTLEGAVVLIYTQKPDLLIVDPEYSEKGKIILECAYPSLTKTVLLSDNPRVQSFVKSDFFLDKPISFEKLQVIIDEVSGTNKKDAQL